MSGKKNITNHLKRALMMGAMMATMGIVGQAGAYMQHLSIMQNKEGVSTEWLEPVDEKVFQSLK